MPECGQKQRGLQLQMPEPTGRNHHREGVAILAVTGATDVAGVQTKGVGRQGLPLIEIVNGTQSAGVNPPGE